MPGFRAVPWLVLILIAGALPTAVQAAIHHCIDANGRPVFTDKPCAALDATPVSAASVAHEPDVPSAPPPILCAADPVQLRQSVIEAFAARDANRLAGLMLWRGAGRGAAVADLRTLATLMKQSLLDVELPGQDGSSGSDGWSASFGPGPPPDGQLVLHTAGAEGGGSPRTTRFGIVHRAGCLWLRNAD